MDFLKHAIRFRADRSGVVGIAVALMFPVLVGFTGLAVDVGYWYVSKRSLQTIADAAALAGAHELALNSKLQSGDKEIEDVAVGSAKNNGFNTGKGDALVVGPPTTGPRAGSSDAVEAVVTGKASLFFSSLFGANAFDVEARAVSGLVDSDSPACIVVLASSGAATLGLNGTPNVKANGCAIQVNSTDQAALDAEGSGGKLTANDICTTGGFKGLSSNFSSLPQTLCAPQTNPLADLRPPSEASLCTPSEEGGQKGSVNVGQTGYGYGYGGQKGSEEGGQTLGGGQKGSKAGGKGRKGSKAGDKRRKGSKAGDKRRKGSKAGGKRRKGSKEGGKGRKGSKEGGKGQKGLKEGGQGGKNVTITENTTLEPGCYEGGISVLAGAKVVFAPGNYILDGGGLSLKGNSSVEGDGVGFYLKGNNASVDLSGGSGVDLSAPVSGALKGLIFAQDANSSGDHKFTGGNNTKLEGTIYFPTQKVNFVGNAKGETTSPLVVIANEIKFSGTGDFTFNGDFTGSKVPPPPNLFKKVVALLE